MKSIFFVLLFFFSTALFANSAKELSIIKLKVINGPKSIGNNFTSKLENHLEDADLFDMEKPSDGLTGNFIYYNCSNSRCVKAIRKLKEEGYLISGTITVMKHVPKKSAISSYAVKSTDTKKYYVYLSILNIKNGKRELVIRETYYSLKSLYNAPGSIANRITKFYSKKFGNTGSKKGTSFGYSFAGLTVSPSYLFPMGDYSDMFDYGYGLDLELNGKISPFDRLYLYPKLGIYNLKESADSIKSAQLCSLYLNLSYYVVNLKGFIMTPYLGAGYVFHYIDGDSDTSDSDTSTTKEFYYDPGFIAGLDLEYRITENTGILLSPSYRIYLDGSTTYSFVCINAGLRMRF